MTNKIKFSLILGLISILLEITSMYYYSDSTLEAACYICFSIFFFSCGDWDLEEEHKDIDVPMTKDFCLMPATTTKTDLKDNEKDNGKYLVEQMLLEKIERFTPEYLKSKSLTFLKEQRFFLYHELRLHEQRLAKFTLEKELGEKLQATYNLVCDTYSKYQAPLNGKLFDTRILFKKDISNYTSRREKIELTEIRDALKWSLEFVTHDDDITRIKTENRLNEVEEQLRKIDPDYFNGLKVMDDPINSL